MGYTEDIFTLFFDYTYIHNIKVKNLYLLYPNIEQITIESPKKSQVIYKEDLMQHNEDKKLADNSNEVYNTDMDYDFKNAIKNNNSINTRYMIDKFDTSSNCMVYDDEAICNIRECPAARRMTNILNKYKPTLDRKWNDAACKIAQITDDYLHILNKHNTDQEIELFQDEIDSCDATKCSSVRRRNRCTQQEETFFHKHCESNVIDNVYLAMMDKIHCYYAHSFGVGRRVSVSDKDKMTYSTNDSFLHDSFVTQDSRNIRYNQLNANDENLTKSDRYDTGCRFVYYESQKEKENDLLFRRVGLFVPVAPKYTSLKEEATNNQICTISAAQFAHERHKADYKHNSLSAGNVGSV